MNLHVLIARLRRSLESTERAKDHARVVGGQDAPGPPGIACAAPDGGTLKPDDDSATASRPRYPDPEYLRWRTVRLEIEQLATDWPPCDERCDAPHEPTHRLVLADLAVEPAQARGASWWNYGSLVEIEHDLEWAAVRPADEKTPTAARLPQGTRLARIASTDDTWGVVLNPETAIYEDLYEILDGPFAGGQLLAVCFGPSDIEAGFAGKLIVLDHLPAWDAGVRDERLAAAAETLGIGIRLQQPSEGQ